MSASASLDSADLPALVTALRIYLQDRIDTSTPLTYQALAQALGLTPPHSIHRVVLALEQSMREDAGAGRPLIAAWVISRTRGGLPAPGFFVLARALALYGGSEDGADARRFHEQQLQALRALS